MDLSNTSHIITWLRKTLMEDCYVSEWVDQRNATSFPFQESPDPGVSQPPVVFSNNYSMALLRFGSSINTTALPPAEFDSQELEQPEWSPTYSNDALVLIILIAYATSLILSFGGNVLAIVVFVRYDYWPKDLRILLTNICVASMLSAVLCLPFTLLYQLLQSWVFTSPLCRIITFLQLSATIGTILTHLAIGLNRLWVIVFPLRASSFQEWVWGIVGVIWLTASAISAPNLITTDTQARGLTGGCFEGKIYLMCLERWGDEMTAAYTWTLMICMYFLPMIVLLCIYGITGYVLSKSQELIHNERTLAKRTVTKRKVLRMLMLIFALFAISWLPLHTFFMVQSFHESLIMNNFEMAERIYWVIHWLATSNSFQNPIVYCFLDDKFKMGVAQLFGCRKTRPGSGLNAQRPGAGPTTNNAATLYNSSKMATTAVNTPPCSLKSPTRRKPSKAPPPYTAAAKVPNGKPSNEKSSEFDPEDTDSKRPLLASDGVPQTPQIDSASLAILEIPCSTPEPPEPSPGIARNGSVVKDSESVVAQGEPESSPSVAEFPSPEAVRQRTPRQSSSSDVVTPLLSPASPTASSPRPPSSCQDGTSNDFFVLYEYTVL